ncbi:MAG: hypothetical protein KDD33_04070 [Bdellovibrionales bacterium]|nr:hypothetical protein [Bdellovibrionales bacterium]
MLKWIHIRENFKSRMALLLFVSFSFLTPAHADITENTRQTTKSFLELGNVNMRFRHRDSRDVVGVLPKGSVIQFPDGVSVLDTNGQIDFAATIRNWTNKANNDPKYAALKPTSGCGGEVCYPVKIIKSPNSAIDTQGRESIGFVALDYILRNVDKAQYRTRRAQVSEVANFNTEFPDSPNAGKFTGGGGETTDNGGVDKDDKDNGAGPSGTQNVYNCSNTTFTRNYANTSCLRNKSLASRAELVMRDVLQINKLRPQFTPDPRFSACISYRESHFHPNAKGMAGEAGMYQVIWSTHTYVRKHVKSVTPGFVGLSASQEKAKMVRSTLAQADLHHAVLYRKATYMNAVNSASKGESEALYKKLAVMYNGSKTKYTYAARVTSCYSCMKGIYTRNVGKKSGYSEGKLKSCLNKASH